MKDRRTLSDAINSPPPVVDAETARRFIHGDKPAMNGGETGGPFAPVQPAPAAQNGARAPISTRIRADFATALKRCSLERQLQGVVPNTLQEILEEAIEPWLKSHGYLP
jgi:hypothetical protein